MNGTSNEFDDLAKCMSVQPKKAVQVRELHKELLPYNPNWRQEAGKTESIKKYARLNSSSTFPNDDRYAR